MMCSMCRFQPRDEDRQPCDDCREIDIDGDKEDSYFEPTGLW